MNPIVSPNVRIRHPDLFSVGDGSIVDDFSYFSTRVVVGRGSHVAACVTVAGGKDRTFRLGDYSGIATGTRILCGSTNFKAGLVTIPPPGFELLPSENVEGDVTFENYTGIGANSVVMPDNVIPEGTVIGSLSFVPHRYPFDTWAIYAGCPLRRVGNRDRDAVMRQLDRIREHLEKVS